LPGGLKEIGVRMALGADPTVFVVSVATLLAAAAIATLIPALRASRMNVVKALRCE
jgi:ABC-type antimicrobial peptide transport system permease subunit